MQQDTEPEIRALLADYTDLWMRHDMREWGNLFTEDSDFITHRGLWWRSRAENVQGHEDVPETVIAQKRNYSQEILDIQHIAPDVVLVHTRWSWPEHLLPAGETAEDRHGLITMILVRRDDRWLIRAAHNTRVNGLHDFVPRQN